MKTEDIEPYEAEGELAKWLAAREWLVNNDFNVSDELVSKIARCWFKYPYESYVFSDAVKPQ